MKYWGTCIVESFWCLDDSYPFSLLLCVFYSEGDEFRGVDPIALGIWSDVQNRQVQTSPKGQRAEKSCCRCSFAPVFANFVPFASIPCPVEMYLGAAGSLSSHITFCLMRPLSMIITVSPVYKPSYQAFCF